MTRISERARKMASAVVVVVIEANMNDTFLRHVNVQLRSQIRCLARPFDSYLRDCSFLFITGVGDIL